MASSSIWMKQFGGNIPLVSDPKRHTVTTAGPFRPPATSDYESQSTFPRHLQHPTVQTPHTRDFVFTSGSRLIEDRSRKSKQKDIDASKTGIKCTHPGCTYKGTFKRKAELQRHTLKHTNAAKYECVVQDCDCTFYRADKFGLHLQNGHGPDDMAVCPQCPEASKPLELVLLRHHVNMHGGERGSYFDVLSFQIRGRWCPIEGCKSWNGYGDVREHIKQHKPRDLKKSQERITKAGYDYRTLHFICPKCQERCADITAFRNHLTLHLVNNQEHYWSLRRQTQKDYHFLDLSTIWKPYFYFGTKGECQFCGAAWTDQHEHFQTLLQDPDDIYPYRLAILKLWPDFGEHPVFDDIRLTPEARAKMDKKWRRLCPQWKRFQS